MYMYLDWDLADLKGNRLIRLDNRRSGGNVEVGLNAARRAFCPLSLEDPALAIASAVDTVLRVVLKGPDEFSLPLFVGRVVIPEETSEADSSQLGLHAIDPMFSLERALARVVEGATWSARVFTATDQSAIMWALIAGAVDHGVIEGSLPASIARDRTYPPGKEVGPALIEMSEVIGGPDFELEPVITTGGTLARFNTYYPNQGTDRSASVVFVHGGSPQTALAFSHTPGGEEICNRFLAIGAPLDQEGEEEAPPYSTNPSYLAEHAASIAKYGVFERREQWTDVQETETLQAHAESVVAASAYPTPYFDFSAAPEQAEEETGEGVPPRFGIDYWLGDTIGIESYEGTADPDNGDDPTHSLTGRVTDATVTELDSGQVAVKVSCAPSVSAAGVTGQALTLLVPEGE